MKKKIIASLSLLTLIFINSNAGNDQSIPKRPLPNLQAYTNVVALNEAIIDYLDNFKQQEIPFSSALGLHHTDEITAKFEATPFSKPDKRKRHLSILLRKNLKNPNFEKKLIYALIIDPDNILSKTFLRTLELKAYLTPINEESPFFESPIHTLVLNRSASYFLITGEMYPTSSVEFLLEQSITQKQIEQDFDEIQKKDLSSALYKALQKTYLQYKVIENRLKKFEQLVITTNQSKYKKN